MSYYPNSCPPCSYSVIKDCKWQIQDLRQCWTMLFFLPPEVQFIFRLAKEVKRQIHLSTKAIETVIKSMNVARSLKDTDSLKDHTPPLGIE